MGIESGNYIADFVTTNPVAADARSEGDDHLRMIKTFLQNTFPGLAGRSFRVQSKSANYTVVATDNMSVINCTAALTLAMTAVATLGNGFLNFIYASGGDVVIDPNSTETVNGSATATIPSGDLGILFCDGTKFFLVYFPLMPISAAEGFTTGDVKFSIKTVADSGWVLMNDGTIGNTASSATTRANTDTANLFTLLWNNTANADCAVSGGRGASAAADYAANKTIALPKALGRALAVYGSGSGLSARTLGQIVGSESLQAHTHTGNTGNQSADHQHGISGAGNVASGASVASTPNNGGTFGYTDGQNASHIHSFTTDSTGSGSAQNMQPTLFLNVMIKL